MILATAIVKKPELEIKVKAVSLKSYWLTISEMRLDASFYAQDVTVATRFLKESGYSIVPLKRFVKNVFYPPRSKRYLTEESKGVPYLTSSDALFLLHHPKYIIPNKIPNIQKWYVKDGWILLTRSGTVGIPLLVTKDLEKYVLSEHLIRIVPKNDSLVGFLYAYLSSWFGEAFIKKDKFGAVVEEIEPHHIHSIPLPAFPEDTQKKVHANIIKALAMREKVKQLLKEAEKLLYKELVIPQSKIFAVSSKCFTVGSSQLNLRLGAPYHTPLVRSLLTKMQKAKYPVEEIANKAEIFIPTRFKRIYVEKEYGIPFLSGTNIMQMKPHHLKYISKKFTKNLEDYLIKEGMVLTAARGTIGRTIPITKSLDGWAASDNIARIIPNQKKIHFGFLALFLNTPYGYYQLVRHVGGSVVNLLQPQHISEVQIPNPPMKIQQKIGKLVVEAYELKELANKIEDDTVHTLEDMLAKHRKVEDAIEHFKDLEAYAETFELIGDEEFREGLDQARKGELVPYGS